jgi:hypothetical protein
MRKKRFDCVEMMHRGGDRIYRATRGMTREQELAYWQAKDREMQERLEHVRRKRKSA